MAQSVLVRPAGSFALQYSASADRSNPLPLDGAVISGTVYVFLTPTAGVSSVTFFKGINQAAYATRVAAPFDIEGNTGGNANPLPAMAADVYQFAAVVATATNTFTVTATFAVAAPVVFPSSVPEIQTFVGIDTPAISSSPPLAPASVASRVGIGTPVISGAASPKSLLGVFKSAQTEASVAAWETSVGRTAAFVLSFDGSVTTWTGLINACANTASVWKSRVVSNSKSKLVVSIVLYPDKAAAGAYTMGAAAAGTYNANYTSIAQQFANQGYTAANLIFRPAWEFNGNYYLWNVTGNLDATSNPANYVAAFRNFVTQVRSVIPGVKVDWCPKLGGNTTQTVLESCYPGNTYVDYIGIDVYDYYTGYNSNTRNNTGWTNGWNSLVNATNGLQWHRTFVIAQGKLASYPEWGALHATSTTYPYGGDDNPIFPESMFNWQSQDAGAGRLGYSNYFEADPSDGYHRYFGGVYAFPNAAARFLTLYGGP